ncbi:MAG: hypothetical protein DHS20C15_10760 [Planctomycetota bacterium]|nr:MAG: hypothetical protein DHS20C15_10760 [Planctomycetota bacterium]
MKRWSALALGGLLACGSEAPPPAVITGTDLLADPALLVERSRSPHALSAELAALTPQNGVLWTRDPPLPASAWVPVENVPARWRSLLDRYPGRQLWRTRQAVRTSNDGGEPWIYLDGEKLPRLNELSLPVPEHVVWYVPKSGSLLSAGATAPEGVVLRRRAEAAKVFGRAHADLAEEHWAPRRHALGEVSRPAILLPPPGRVVLELGTLQAERVDFAVGHGAQDLSLVDGDVARGEASLGDGFRLALEVQPAGEEPQRVWSAELRPPESNAAWLDVSVDLSAFRGRSCRLHLVSEALGESAFDLALWSSLRLRGGEPAPPERPHVVLVVLDTLRADALGAYGQEPSRTPRTDAWIAERGVVVNDVVSTAAWTLPATTSLFTGLATHQHRVQRAIDVLPSSGPPTLAELFAAGGYETRALTAGGYLRPAFGLDRGFDRYETLELRSAAWQPTLDWLGTRESSAPVMLLVHTYWVHAPWPWDERYLAPDYDGPLAGEDVDYDNVMEPYWDGDLPLDEVRDGAALRALYDALLAELDTHLGRLLDSLEAQLGEEGLVVVITSDHGEALLEHGVLGHGQALWQELLSVPLIVRRASGQPGRLDTPASLIDVLPTLLAEAGLPRPEGLPGRELFAPGRVRDLRVAQLDDTHQAVLSEGRKLVLSSKEEVPTRLFDLSDDPEEARDLSESEPEWRAQLTQRLADFLAEFPPPSLSADETAGLDEATLAELRQLGYLSDEN